MRQGASLQGTTAGRAAWSSRRVETLPLPRSSIRPILPSCAYYSLFPRITQYVEIYFTKCLTFFRIRNIIQHHATEGMRMKVTMLEGLCAANGQQGGTIHQFFADANSPEVTAMRRAFNEYTSCGLEFPSRASFNKLAKQYHLTIQWRK